MACRNCVDSGWPAERSPLNQEQERDKEDPMDGTTNSDRLAGSSIFSRIYPRAASQQLSLYSTKELEYIQQPVIQWVVEFVTQVKHFIRREWHS